jgi:hypothetical protein
VWDLADDRAGPPACAVLPKEGRSGALLFSGMGNMATVGTGITEGRHAAVCRMTRANQSEMARPRRETLRGLLSNYSGRGRALVLGSTRRASSASCTCPEQSEGGQAHLRQALVCCRYKPTALVFSGVSVHGLPPDNDQSVTTWLPFFASNTSTHAIIGVSLHWALSLRSGNCDCIRRITYIS